MCFECSRELSHRDGSSEYPQHTFWLRNKKNNFQLHTLIWVPDNKIEISENENALQSKIFSHKKQIMTKNIAKSLTAVRACHIHVNSFSRKNVNIKFK